MARHPTGFHFMIIPFVAHLVILSRQSFRVNPFLGAQKLGFDCDEACSERRSRKTTAAKRGRMNFISLFDVCCIFVLNKKRGCHVQSYAANIRDSNDRGVTLLHTAGEHPSSSITLKDFLNEKFVF